MVWQFGSGGLVVWQFRNMFKLSLFGTVALIPPSSRVGTDIQPGPPQVTECFSWPAVHAGQGLAGPP